MKKLLTSIVAALSINFAACADSKPHQIYQPDTVSDTAHSDSNQSDTGCENKPWFPDLDEDGYGDKQMNIYSCQPPDDGNRYVRNFLDCDDTDSSINPEGIEICNGKNDNCKDGIDEDMISKMVACDPNPNPFCKEQKFKVCGGSAGWVETPCAVYNSTEEICDNFDNDCDGEVDENLTQTCYNECGDGLETCVEGLWKNCDAPKPTEEICDGLDNDCDGITDMLIEQTEKECDSYHFIFLIDDSGSMVLSDPLKLRYEGLHKLVDGSWQDDYGLVMVFADYYKVIGTFTQDKEVLHQNIDISKNIYVGPTTNITYAVANAINEFPIDGKKAIILLTDGEDMASSQYPANQLAKDNGVEICAFKLGGYAGPFLLDLVAGVGGVEQIYFAEDIAQKFLQAYSIFKCAEVHECVDGEMVKKTSGCLKQ